LQLRQITPVLFNQAIEIYLEHAYDDRVLRESHAVHFDESLPIHDVLAALDREETRLASYSLRLGCQHYPHMKLALWEAYYHDEYIFAVDRHDGFDFSHTGPDYEGWLGIKSKNFRIKVVIEDAWYAAGIPTMRRIKEERLSQSDVLREFSGHTVLLVDNDADAGAVLQMILSGSGYGCVWAAGIKEARAILADPDRRSRCGMALVDLMLSDGSGVDVVKAIRACPDTQDIPVLLTSAMNGSDVVLADADGYLRKPYSGEDLLQTIANTLRRRYDGHARFLDEKAPGGPA